MVMKPTMNLCPLISVVLPTYNGSKYLESSIKSIVSQTYHNWELIIVDDASTDDTWNIISRYAKVDGRIVAVKNDENMRLPASLNKGFSLARGDFFSWTSDDNYYRRNAFERMLNALTNGRGYQVVYSDFSLVDSRDKVLRRVRVSGFEKLCIENCIGACFMYLREVHDTLGGFDNSKFLVEDYDFWLRASSLFRFFPINEDLYLFRKHDDSLSATRKDNIAEARYALLKEAIPLVSWMTEKEKRNILIRNETFWIWQHYSHARYRETCISAANLFRRHFFNVHACYVALRFIPISLLRALTQIALRSRSWT